MIELNKDVQEQIDQSVRVRSVGWLILAVALLMSGALLFASARFFKTYDELEDATEQYSKCQRAMSRFQEASGNLTDQMRFYAVTGEEEYLKNYFQEAASQRRDKALLTFQEYIRSEDLLSSAVGAMDSSNELMKEEHYILYLAAVGHGVQQADLREELQGISLRPEHEGLSTEEKQQAAVDLAFGEKYDNARQDIDDKTRTFLNDLLEDLSARREDYKTRLDLTERVTYGLIIVFFGVVCLSFVVIFRLVILPLIRSQDSHLRASQ